jgi:type I restriction enzyme R subunit
LNGQDVEDAIRQCMTTRDPRDPLLAYGPCLAHFAVDPHLVYVTTALTGPRTRFLPFSQGKFGGAGNPPVPPTRLGYPTGYRWEETWARDSVLDLVRQCKEHLETMRGGNRLVNVFRRDDALINDVRYEWWALTPPSLFL